MEAAFHENHYFAEPRKLGDVALIQAARVHCLPGTLVAPHVHLNWFELTVATEGEGTVYTGDDAVFLQKGEIFLSFPADCHAIRSDEYHPLHYDCLSFRCDRAEDEEKLEAVMAAYREPASRKFDDTRIPVLVGEILGELGDEQTDSGEILSHLVHLTVLAMLRKMQVSSPQLGTAPANQAERFCFRMMNYIDTHIFTLSNLSELSEATNYSYSYISRQFHAAAKCTVQEYYQSSRMKTARLLLREGKLKVGEIAELLHYASIYAFSKAYKHFYGLSPTLSAELPRESGRDLVTQRVLGTEREA